MTRLAITAARWYEILMSHTIAIVDYGSGNLRSAAKAFEKVISLESLDYSVVVTDDAKTVQNTDRIVLPGQGAFGSCMQGLKSLPGMTDALYESVMEKERPFLGICVGMQLLADKGFEHGEHDGFGWVAGNVVPVAPDDPALKIPHMGWNTLYISETGRKHPVLKNVGPDDHFYFVHSFMFEWKEEQNHLASTEYGQTVTAIVGRDNIIGVQFHPEKSQKAGLGMIRDYLLWKP